MLYWKSLHESNFEHEYKALTEFDSLIGDYMYQYQTDGVCASEIHFQVKDGHVCNVHFDGGCHGNLQAICKLVEGMPVNEVIEKLRGIECQNGTSCPDQLAVALTEAMNQ